MSGSGRTIAKNIGAMMASQLITWVLAFLLAIFLPRYLGAEAVGQLAIANSLWIIMGVLISFGMDLYLTKAIAREPSKVGELLGTSLIIRVAFFLIACVVVAAYMFALGYDQETMYISALLSGSFLLLSLYGALVAVLTGLERMEFISLSNIASKALLTGLSLLAMVLGSNIYWIAAVGVPANLAAVGIAAYALRGQNAFRFRFDLQAARSMVADSAKYLVTGISLVAYQQVDKLFISAMVDTTTVGWYGAAMNLFGTLMFVPVVIGNVLLPTLARSYANGEDRLNQIARRGFDFMFLLSIPIGLGLIIIANPLVTMLYGPEFVQSGPILAILGVVLIFTYMNTLVGQLLISTERTKPWNIVMIIAIVITLPLDLVLVPWTHQQFGNGALGGVFAFLITEFGMLVAAILLLPAGTMHWQNVRTTALTLVCGLLMMASSWWVHDQIFLSIPIAAVVYIATILLFRVIPPDDFALIKDMALNLLNRVLRNRKAPASIGD